jgi:hypothetical protein
VHYAPETRFSQDNCKKAGQQQNQEQHNNHVLNEAFGVPSANVYRSSGDAAQHAGLVPLNKAERRFARSQ